MTDDGTLRPRWIDGEMEQPWFRDLIAGSTGKVATLGPLEAVAWMARRRAALTPATEEQS